MNARYYVPAVGRFASADTLIPDPTNPQDFNRYSYVRNNPIKFNDPSGHYVVESDEQGAYSCATYSGCTNASQNPITGVVGKSCGKGCTVTIDSKGRAQEHIQTQPHPRPGRSETVSHPAVDDGCQMSLKDCHLAGILAEFEDFERINRDEFNELLGLIANEMYYGWTPASRPLGLIAGRGEYDTPFWNGDYDSDQQVCFDDLGCWGRAEVNYVAQGMWSAAAGQSLEEALELIEWWNQSQYGHGATEGEIYWTSYGYEWYYHWLTQGES